MQNRHSSVMSLWVSCVLLSCLIRQTEQNGHLPPVEDVTLYAEETEISNSGAWVLNVAWRDEFVENTKPEKLTYDIEVLRTEQMMSVHSETIQVKADLTTRHHWKWTSPLPLQCTSHSVRLRRRDQHHTGNWSALYTYKGQDLNASETTVYPHDQYFLAGSSITFCCIMKAETVPSFSSPIFEIRISNRTIVTKPVHFDNAFGLRSLNCEHAGTTVFIGYPPDDQNLKCVTQDLSSVQCSWNRGRETHIEGLKGETKYTLNGRHCHIVESGECVLPENTETSWTLTAENPLGVKVINDTAEPLHRVLLKAPKNLLSTAYKRNAILQWSWDVEKYGFFPMICQVELNGHIYNKTFSGKGLESVVLEDLQPDTGYRAKVHCVSSEHFYKWSEWSQMIHFRTNEDIPEAVDVWMQYLEESAYVLWKPLTKEQSHGVLTGYEVTITDSKNKTSSNHTGPNTNCYSISSENETGAQMISVSANNSAGLSLPVSIIITRHPGSRVDISRRINGSNGGFDMVWMESVRSSCGYVVDWFPTYSQEQCAVRWKKIPAGRLSTRIESDVSEVLQPGVRYTVSVYSCTAVAPQLLQRREGYAIERQPFGTVQNVKDKLNGKDLVLTWKEVPLDKQGGFILGYKVIIFNYDSNTTMKPMITENPTVRLTLDPGSYSINISAFTSAGEGVEATIHRRIEKDFVEMIVATVLASSVAAFVFIIITLLCYRRRKWLKKMLYPDIPEPKLSGKWTKKGIYCSDMTERYMKCDIQEVHNIERPALDTADGIVLIRSNSILCPTNHLYQNHSEFPVVSSFTAATSFITLDPISSRPCAQKFTSAIENPTYILSPPELVNMSLLSEPALEMDDSYLPTPNVVHNTFHDKDSRDYKPQLSCK